jgi:hypothetical protein
MLQNCQEITDTWMLEDGSDLQIFEENRRNEVKPFLQWKVIGLMMKQSWDNLQDKYVMNGKLICIQRKTNV